MNTYNETILLEPKGLPLGIRTVHYFGAKMHCRSHSEIIFILQGETTLLINGKSYHLIPEDIVLFNCNQIYQLISQNCLILSFYYEMDKLPLLDQKREYFFDLNSSGQTYNQRYNHIRYLMACMVKACSASENIYRILSLMHAISSDLIENFSSFNNTSRIISDKNTKKMSKILTYIQEHYADNLTLNTLSQIFYISPQYLASSFKKLIGKSFLTYYNEIRLSSAIVEMLSTSKSLEQIALTCGFGDYRAFASTFKKIYNCTPSTYRSEHLQMQPKTSDNFVKKDFLNNANDFSHLVKYLDFYSNETPYSAPSEWKNFIIEGNTIDFFSDTIPLKHNYRRMCCVGSARQLLYADVQDMIRTVQNEIHYEYIKFHGILSDEMMVYTENYDGTPTYSFTLIDKVIDFLLSVHLKPLLQLSFMPYMLASDPEKMIDMRNFNTSPPKDMNKWLDLVCALINHLISRYGVKELRSWLFCVWNEPDVSKSSFGWDNDFDFYTFYRETYRAVKFIDSKFRFGSPSLLVNLDSETSWAGSFFRYCNEYHCIPDFINIHYYDDSFFAYNDAADIDLFSLNNIEQISPLNEDSNAFTKFINSLKQNLGRFHMKHTPIYLTEWNLTISHRNPINDTCFKACYLIKNLLENYDRLESFGYWCLTDFLEELQLPNNLYHGGLGMFTYNGIPKAHYNAFRFLTYLENNMIGKGNGYFVTKGQKRIVMLLYNYEHYSKLFASGILFDMDESNRYAPFTKMNNAKFIITFINLPCEECLIKERYINQTYGSSYDAWTRMGAQPLSRKEDLDILRQQSQPAMHLHRQKIQGGHLSFETQLAPLEVRLVEIELTT